MVPERARERMLDIAATQLPDGGAYHQYQPLTKRGNDAIGSGFNDDPLWLVLAVAAYLKETGDPAILDEPVPTTTTPGSEAPLYDHLAAVHRLHARAPRAARPAADRPRRLERLPEPQLLLGRRPASRSRRPRTGGRRRRVGLHRRPVRARGATSSRRSPTAAGRRRSERARAAARADGRGRRRRTAGTATGSAARTTTSGNRSARPRTTRARSSSSRRASASWPASGSTTGGPSGAGLGPRAARDAARDRARAAGLHDATTSSSARSRRIRRATRRTGASSATRTRG